MSIEEQEYATTLIYANGLIDKLKKDNQRLSEQLDETRKEWREMFSKGTDVLMALYMLNLCCPDPETMEFATEDGYGKEDYVDAIARARSLL